MSEEQAIKQKYFDQISELFCIQPNNYNYGDVKIDGYDFYIYLEEKRLSFTIGRDMDIKSIFKLSEILQTNNINFNSGHEPDNEECSWNGGENYIEIRCEDCVFD